jgi:hypothetical protein|tara:strand:- start:440 stop:751 length:312 start_codon:yes stop_codon:yes gene_type:complete
MIGSVGRLCAAVRIGRMLSGKFARRNYFGKQIGTAPNIKIRLPGLGRMDRRADAQYGGLHHGYLPGRAQDIFAFKGEEIGVFMTKQAEWSLDEYSGFSGGRRL